MGRDGKIARETDKHLIAFETWYVSQKNVKKTLELLASSTPPINVGKDTIYNWITKYSWDAKAKERDDAVIRDRTEKAIKEQAEFLARKGNYGKLIQRRALEFLNSTQKDAYGNPVYRKDAAGNLILDTNGNPVPMPVQHITNAATAVQAIQVGVLLEQQAMGLPEWITEVMNADPATLRRVYDTALAELAAVANIDATETGSTSAFAPVEIKPLQ